MKVKSYITYILSLFSLSLHAQETYTIIPDTPPSPQAVAFNRLGDYEVDNNYGVPNINIPLFEIDFHGYKIPLSLHYEASPLKPGYNYDVTGLGWTLSGNSCVSRIIKDRADEYGLFGNPFKLDSFQNSSGQSIRYMDWANSLEKLNFKYDSYNIVLPSGRTIPFFMYKESGVMTYKLMSADNKVKITCSYGSNSIDAFTVKDENGITYQFTVADKANNGFENDVNAYRNVTWLLTSIDIPAKGTITYDYTPLQTINTHTISEPMIRVSRLISEMSEDAQERRINVTKTLQAQSPRYTMRFISRISYGPTNIDFNYTSDGTHMQNIIVRDCGDTIKTFTLGINGSALTSLVISGQSTEDELDYGFAYTNNIPGNYTDYWGNLCDSNNNYDLGNFNMYIDKVGIDRTTLENQLSWDGNPACVIDNNPDDLNYYYKIKLQAIQNEETRHPTSPQYHGVLSRITYPNGGYTTFNFENHRFLTASSTNGDIVFDRRRQRIAEGGGFRIESIINWTADGQIASKDYYRYGFTYNDIVERNFPLPTSENYNINDHIGCGEAVVDPNLLTFMSYSNSSNVPNGFRKMAVGLPSDLGNIQSVQGTAMWWDAFFSANTFRSLIAGRRPVIYPEITVYHGHPYEQNECISKTVYKYDIYDYQLSPQNYYMSYFNQTSLPDTAYLEPLYYLEGSGLVCLESPAKRHQIKSKYDYSYTNGTWCLVSKEEYSSNKEQISSYGYIYDSTISRGHCGNHTLQSGQGRRLEDICLSEFYQPISQKLGKSTLASKSTTTLRQGGTCTNDNILTEHYNYLYSGVLKKSMSHSNSYTKGSQYTFIGEMEDSDSIITEMKRRNMFASPVSTTTYVDPYGYGPFAISGNKIDYALYGNCILPSKINEFNKKDIYYYENQSLNDCDYELSAEIESYDSFGNPTEIKDVRTGIHSVFIWDTYGRYLVATIKGATLSQIQGFSSQLIESDSRSRHATLQSMLPNTQIETWDYQPLIGVTSHTDVCGRTTLYEYDGLGRLKTEKRVVNGVTSPETLREYEYNYLNQ